jgi:hypothetical protein
MITWKITWQGARGAGVAAFRVAESKVLNTGGGT